ncbi:MAG: ABC transporter substrate-binding protein [Lachnospiraceae bacterium]
MKKKVVSVLLCVAMVATMAAGCGSKKSETTDTEKKDTTASSDLSVEIVAKGFQHDFWKAVKLGAEKAGTEFGAKINFVGPKDESAVAEQVEQLNNAINKKPSAICLAALDTDSVLGALDTAKSSNIPIIGFDSGVPEAEDFIAANAATDNYAAGELAADKLYELIKDKVTDPKDTVRIGVVSQDATSQSIGDRTGGFVDKMVKLIGEDKATVEGHDKYNKKVDGAKVVIEVGIPATVEDAACVTVANTILNKNDLVAVYGSNEFSAKNIITANESLQKLGADKVIGIGFDSGEIQLNAIKDGIFAGSITQDPVQIGYQAVTLAVKAAKGESVSDVDTGCLWYTKDNMEDENIAPCLYK